jgi:RES domain-containing protein
VRIWRLCLQRHAAPDGEGARLYGGRWNSEGTAVVYTSATLSLAVLEYLVNLDSDILPDDLVALSADIPEHLGIHTIRTEDLPSDWREYPAPDELKAMGTAWAAARRSVILSVPSVIIPEERNYLVNPAHPEFGRIHWNAPTPFRFDPRLRR